MESAFRKLLTQGLTREVLGCGLDSCQLRSRSSELRDDNRRAIEWTLGKILSERPELTGDQRQNLTEMLIVVAKHPENAFAELGEFRRSFVAPVPGQLGERIGPE